MHNAVHVLDTHLGRELVGFPVTLNARQQGDSAGGNLIMTMVLRAISMNIDRLPNALVQVDTSFMFAYTPLPSRSVHMMGPLQHTGVVTRCIAGIFALFIDKLSFSAYTNMLENDDLTGKPSHISASSPRPSIDYNTE